MFNNVVYLLLFVRAYFVVLVSFVLLVWVYTTRDFGGYCWRYCLRICLFVSRRAGFGFCGLPALSLCCWSLVIVYVAFGWGVFGLLCMIVLVWLFWVWLVCVFVVCVWLFLLIVLGAGLLCIACMVLLRVFRSLI